MENLDILAANGFGLAVDEDAPYGRGERIRLTSMPVSKETVFDVSGEPVRESRMHNANHLTPSDLEELIFLLQDHYIGSMVRSKKARAMFAMRACRKSVMFGKALSRSQMVQVSLLLAAISLHIHLSRTADSSAHGHHRPTLGTPR